MENSENELNIHPSSVNLETAQLRQKESLMVWEKNEPLDFLILLKKITTYSPKTSDSNNPYFLWIKEQIEKQLNELEWTPLAHKKVKEEKIRQFLQSQSAYQVTDYILEPLFQPADKKDDWPKNINQIAYYLLHRDIFDYLVDRNDKTYKGTRLQRILTDSFLHLAPEVLAKKVSKLEEMISFFTDVIISKEKLSKLQEVKGSLYGVLSGTASCAFGLRTIKQLLGEEANLYAASAPRDLWDYQHKIDGVVWNADRGKIVALLQSKSNKNFQSGDEVHFQMADKTKQVSRFQESPLGATHTKAEVLLDLGKFSELKQTFPDGQIRLVSSFEEKGIKKFLEGAFHVDRIYKDIFSEETRLFFSVTSFGNIAQSLHDKKADYSVQQFVLDVGRSIHAVNKPENNTLQLFNKL